VSFLRSSLLAALVSLLYLAGYSHGSFHHCCEEQTEQADCDDGDAGEDGPQHHHSSHCLCQEIFFSNAAEPVRVLAAVLTSIEEPARLDERPPETVPVGIDYPPQLA
jgi:hypothetical protein